MTYAWDPDWCMRPGVHLQDWMDENGMGKMPGVLGMACGRVPEEIILGVLDGSVEINPKIAACLERGTMIPARLWLRLEEQYRAALAAGKKDVSDR